MRSSRLLFIWTAALGLCLSCGQSSTDHFLAALNQTPLHQRVEGWEAEWTPFIVPEGLNPADLTVTTIEKVWNRGGVTALYCRLNQNNIQTDCGRKALVATFDGDGKRLAMQDVPVSCSSPTEAMEVTVRFDEEGGVHVWEQKNKTVSGGGLEEVSGRSVSYRIAGDGTIAKESETPLELLKGDFAKFVSRFPLLELPLDSKTDSVVFAGWVKPAKAKGGKAPATPIEPIRVITPAEAKTYGLQTVKNETYTSLVAVGRFARTENFVGVLAMGTTKDGYRTYVAATYDLQGKWMGAQRIAFPNECVDGVFQERHVRVGNELDMEVVTIQDNAEEEGKPGQEMAVSVEKYDLSKYGHIERTDSTGSFTARAAQQKCAEPVKNP